MGDHKDDWRDDLYPRGGRFVTDDALRAIIGEMRTSVETGLQNVRADIKAARIEAEEGHQRLREDLTRRLSDAVEARVRIEILEANQKALLEARRFMWAQVVAASGVVAAIVGLVIAWKVHP